MAQQTVDEVLDRYATFEDYVPEECRYSNPQLTTMQINIGYRCNLACKHCHLQCGPNRNEMMDRRTLQACLDAYVSGGFSSMDITGGAPEMHPDFEWFLGEVSKRGIKPICRTNLCILTEPQYEHFAEVYARYDVTVAASLPYYEAPNCDKIRGAGTFEASIKAMRLLNSFGYGTGKHTLTLVYNPANAVLPPDQSSLENEYRTRLSYDYGVSFDNLIAIANNPSGRFAERLNSKDKLGKYMERLIDAFNVDTCAGMMCRDQISIDYNGVIYDCDFNQALGLPVESCRTIFDLVGASPEKRHIVFRNHCYGCTAGAGSSCGGSTA